MNQDAIDLARVFDDAPEPSSMLVHDVMRRIRREAYAPPPLAFPWRRAAVAVALPMLAAFAWGLGSALDHAAIVPCLWAALGGIAALMGTSVIRAACAI